MPNSATESMIANARDVEKLRRTWLASGSFVDEQAYLAAKVRAGAARLVVIDPDGTVGRWLAVVVQCHTGVVYASACEGMVARQRLVEGYQVLLGGSKFAADDAVIDVSRLTDVFHAYGVCVPSWTGRHLPAERLAALTTLIGEIPYWRCTYSGAVERPEDETGARAKRGYTRLRLRVDEYRIEQIAEAWIPVETPDGPGVLLYKNCG